MTIFDDGFDEDDEITGDEEEEYDDSENEDAYASESTDDEALPTFDMTGTVILGSMIAGNAYEEARDRKNRLKLLRPNDNRKE